MEDMSLRLSQDEIRLAEEACRSLAGRRWHEAQRERSSAVKQAFAQAAGELEKLADRFLAAVSAPQEV